MKILSLDTTMAACSAAVIDTDASMPLARAFVAMERGHAEALPPMVARVMEEAGLAFAQIDRLAVTTGPGTFAGVRIGLAFARGLALARGIPAIGIDSLSAIAANEDTDAPLLVVSDARNGEVYAAAFDAGRTILSPPHVSTAAEVATRLAPGTLVLGSAAAAVIAASGRADLKLSSACPLPVAARFGWRAAGIEAGPMPGPLYLRTPDARPQSAPLRRIGSMTAEPAGSKAAGLLARLHGEVFEEGWTERAFAELLATPGAEALIALEQGEPLGFLLTRSAADEAEVITIGTRPSLQRRGVARQLLAQQADRLAARGIRYMFLEVAASNAAAQGLYAALGFHEAGRRKGYYRRRDGGEDAIVMRRELGR